MEYELVELNEKIVVGRAIRTTNANGQSARDIGESWFSFINGGIYASIENKLDAKAIGLYTNYEGDETAPYSFMCCAEVEKVEEYSDLEVKTIGPGKYAKFTINGNMITAVCEAWSEIWKLDLDRKFDTDFELYHNDSEDLDNQTIEIFISVR